MKKKFSGALAFAAVVLGSQALAAELSVQSPAVLVSSVKITGQNNAAYVTVDSILWGNGVYSLDLSQANPYSREMLSLLTTAVNTGKPVRFFVEVDPSPTLLECDGTPSAPACNWGARLYRVQLNRN